MTHSAHISLEQVTRRFGNVVATESVSLTVPVGGFTALIGPSGCGKTTLLRLMGGLDQPTSGSVHRSDASLAFVFQEPRLLPWRTLLDNVALPLELSGVSRAERHARAAAAIALVRMSDAITRTPDQLSGGMRMRASIARALVSRPTLLLLDEPFASLDEVARHELDGELRELWERERFTAVLITHSVPEAVFLAEEVLVCSPQPARIVARIATPPGARTHMTWTSSALNTAAREASEAMLSAITERARERAAS